MNIEEKLESLFQSYQFDSDVVDQDSWECELSQSYSSTYSKKIYVLNDFGKKVVAWFVVIVKSNQCIIDFYAIDAKGQIFGQKGN